MNKLLGFFELQRSGLPSIKWEIFEPSMHLDEQLLWTVRTAVLKGDDLNLPRKVGVTADAAYNFALEQYNKLQDQGMVIVYPYFIATKSGTLEVGSNLMTIEAVYSDLWNLVSENKKDITIHESKDNSFIVGNEKFFTPNELKVIKQNIPRIKHVFRDVLTSGKTVLFEWSFAFNTDVKKKAIGKEYLVIYEARTL